jgi:hypothetical protein
LEVLLVTMGACTGGSSDAIRGILSSAGWRTVLQTSYRLIFVVVRYE